MTLSPNEAKKEIPRMADFPGLLPLSSFLSFPRCMMMKKDVRCSPSSTCCAFHLARILTLAWRTEQRKAAFSKQHYQDPASLSPSPPFSTFLFSPLFSCRYHSFPFGRPTKEDSPLPPLSLTEAEKRNIFLLRPPPLLPPFPSHFS